MMLPNLHNVAMSKKLKISLVLPTYNEGGSIKKCILDFQNTKVIDEIIVVDNNSKYDVKKSVKGTKAKVVVETIQGYGAAIQQGLRCATGDLVVVCEPDGTFIANDIFKLLSYSSEVDMVLGSRTTQALIWQDANMGLFLKWGNYFTGKLIEFAFNTVSVTDAGCTYRLIKRQALVKMLPFFSIVDGTFGPEMIILAAKKNLSFIQIPVNYKKRVGASGYTGTFLDALNLGLQMIIYILSAKLNIKRYE